MLHTAIYNKNVIVSKQQLELEVAVLRLARMHESMRRRQEALISESLNNYKMSSFLFEADNVDVKATASSLDMAIEAADKMLKVTEEAADKLDSAAIKKITSELRDKLQKVSLEGRLEPDAVKDLQKSDGEKKSKIVSLTRDASNFILDKLGYTTKQLTFITQSLSNVNKTIFATASAVSKMLKMSKIDLEGSKDNTLKDIFVLGDLSDEVKGKLGYKDEASFKEALVKVIKGSFGAAKGLLAKIKGFLEGAGADPINLDPSAFADDMINTPLGKIIEWTNSEAAKIAKKPEAAVKSVTAPIGNAAASAGTDTKAVSNAAREIVSGTPARSPSSSSTTSTTSSDEGSDVPLKMGDLVTLAQTNQAEFKKKINARAKKLGAKDGNVVERKFTRRKDVLTERWALLAGIKDED